ncbi:MAG TPA: ATP-binding protein [Planctomycetota bacterium]|nr:ATP-binding protein [Planctomycetota bacterium]
MGSPSSNVGASRAPLGFLDALIPRQLLQGDPESARRARLLVVLAAASIPISLVIWIYLSWGLGAPALARTLAFTTLLGVLSLGVLRGTRQVGPAAFFVGLVLYGVQTYLAARLGGLNVAVLLWSFAFPIVAALLRANWRVFLWIVLVLAQMTGLYIAQTRGWLAPAEPSPPAADLFSLLAFLVFVAIFLSFSLRLWDRKEEERRRLEERLAMMQKMDSLGRFAGGVAHDFNNLLMVIQNSADLAHQALPSGSPVRADLEAIRDASERAAALTRQILLFSRKERGAVKEVLDLNRVVTDVFRLIRGLVPENIDLTLQVSAEPLPVLGVRGQIERVLMNLAANARDAMSAGGRLRVETRVAEHGVGGDLPAGRYAYLTVEDTGTGIAPEDLHRIFEPFYTSKDRTEGTGLGLAVVYGIVAEAGGTVRFESTPGKGSRFSILLPRIDASSAPAAEAPVAAHPVSLARHATILIVEDQESVLLVTERALLSMGYRVLPARDGRHALEIWERHREEIDLVLTDVVMPGLSGPELVRKLLADRPDLKVVFMSGYADSHLSMDDLKEGVRFIPKPFKPSDLLRQVEDLLRVA